MTPRAPAAITCDSFDSPLGQIMLGDRRGALCFIQFVDAGQRESLWAALAARCDAPLQSGESALLERARRELLEYFAGRRRQFDLPLAPHGTEFQQAVWRCLREIPYGTTASYADVARRVGNPAATRAVGAANGSNPLPIVIPCHRVVNANGTLGGFSGGLWRKQKLLALEAPPFELTGDVVPGDSR